MNDESPYWLIVLALCPTIPLLHVTVSIFSINVSNITLKIKQIGTYIAAHKTCQTILKLSMCTARPLTPRLTVLHSPCGDFMNCKCAPPDHNVTWKDRGLEVVLPDPEALCFTVQGLQNQHISVWCQGQRFSQETEGLGGKYRAANTQFSQFWRVFCINFWCKCI